VEEASPEIRQRIEAELNPSLVADRDLLQRQLADIENELKRTKGENQEQIVKLDREKREAQIRLETIAQQLGHARLVLAGAAMKDASWLDFVRRTMIPRQPGRVPFHNSAEVALRGYHAAAGGRQTPVLQEVTWSKLPDVEGELHRGYKAGIIFTGNTFVPGITWTRRRRGESGPPTGNEDYSWHLPNIYFGDHLEVSVADDEIEGPLSWRDYEFQVKNPEGQTSAWVLFTYPFDEDLLTRIRSESFQRGNELLAAGKAAEAIEPLRKAYVFSNRMQGINHEETVRANSFLQRARDEAALAKLRFRVDEQLTVIAGPHEGKRGAVVKLLLNHVHAYLIKPAVGGEFQASDAQVDRAGPL
jgi:hypothetical protein